MRARCRPWWRRCGRNWTGRSPAPACWSRNWSRACRSNTRSRSASRVGIWTNFGAWAIEAASILREAGGYKVNDDLGWRMPTLRVDIDQARANALGVVNTMVGRVMQSAFGGLKVTELREGDHLVPVVIRLGGGRAERGGEEIRSMYVESLTTRPVPLSGFADVRISTRSSPPSRGTTSCAAPRSARSRPWGNCRPAVLERARAEDRRHPRAPGLPDRVRRGSEGIEAEPGGDGHGDGSSRWP
jgi:hypothetical protein